MGRARPRRAPPRFPSIGHSPVFGRPGLTGVLVVGASDVDLPVGAGVLVEGCPVGVTVGVGVGV